MMIIKKVYTKKKSGHITKEKKTESEYSSNRKDTPADEGTSGHGHEEVARTENEMGEGNICFFDMCGYAGTPPLKKRQRSVGNGIFLDNSDM